MTEDRIFKYFKEICAIPHGSGNMNAIADYCVDFARKHCLKVLRDKADNVIIYKDATKGYEKEETVILQGHLDMVCQKDEGVVIDFEKDGLDVYTDGDYIKAKGTTLGADNGIAVAMILTLLESDTYEHPALEAVFTTDEEVGMIGAMQLDFSALKGTRMINIDSEDENILTVSCAGGSDFEMRLPLNRHEVKGTALKLVVRGLQGGHSGVEIDKGRVNANVLMARILNFANKTSDFSLVSADGGDKANAIPAYSQVSVVSDKGEDLAVKLKEYAEVIREEIKFREPDFEFDVEIEGKGAFDAISSEQKDKIIFALLCAPGGVEEMSVEIENLVETSLNLGILKTGDKELLMHFALRSNKTSALMFLESKLEVFAGMCSFAVKKFGHYPPWEFKSDSVLQKKYKDVYKAKTGREIKVEAIHAGLECGVFASAISGLDCISVGPQMYDIHTPRERVSMSSVKEVFGIILEVLK